MQNPRQAIQDEMAELGLPQLSGNIYAIGRNYADHAKELNNPVPDRPVVFLKAPSSLRQAASGPLAFPEESFHHEIELVFLIGGSLKPDWTSIVAMTLGLDLTRRGLQNQLKQEGLPWTLAKSFQGSAILGPWRCLEKDWWQKAIDLSLEVNHEQRQSGSSEQMIFDAPSLLQFLSQQQPLESGDLIFSGTPAGVAGIRRGDHFRMRSQRLKIDCQGIL